MKKNIFNKILLICILLLFSNNIKALTAKAPATIPSEDTTMYGKVDTAFDYSKISFSSSPSGVTITGKTDMKKIMLATGYTATGLNEDWFSAYCLDGKKKYPVYGLSNYTASTDTVKLQVAVEETLFELSTLNLNLNTLLSGVSGYDYLVSNMIVVNDSTGASIFTAGNASATSILAGTETVVYLNSITYSKSSTDTSNVKTITGADLNTALPSTGYSETNGYPLTIKTNDIQYDKYSIKNMSDSIMYNNALWIIEHSYPTLTLETSLADAGASYTTLLTEVAALNPTITDPTAIADLAENYVYSTIQYAIWKVTDGIDSVNNGTTYKLGSTLTGSDQLSKLYQYLIKNRAIYATYGSSTNFNNTLTIAKPESGKEVASENTTITKYGPYSVTGGMLSIGDAALTIANKDKTGIRIVDKAENDITSVRSEEEFYIITEKSAKVTNVSVTVTVADGVTFTPAGNRGRIYFPANVLEQYVATGGKTAPATATQTLEIVLNPDTGVQNIALVLVITLVAFSLGYLVLKYKNNPVEF